MKHKFGARKGSQKMSDEKKTPMQAQGNCSICKGWIDDGKGGTCIFADDYWSPHCPYDEIGKSTKEII